MSSPNVESSSVSRDLKRVAVFCGSSDGVADSFVSLAEEVGRALAAEGITMVYGGGRSGLMGATAGAAMSAGGKVIGVIPGGLFSNEIPDDDVTELHVVADMHARKKMMYDLSDAFLALPGGLGTLEEVFEAATWTQLGLHSAATGNGADKTVVLLDTDGFWNGVVQFLDNASATGFIGNTNRGILRYTQSVPDALAALRAAPTREAPRYVRGQTD